MKKAPFKIGLVDDHVLVREALGVIIRGFDEFTISLMADNGKDFIKNVNPSNLPDLIVLDLNMPEMNGHATAEWISKNYPDVRILVVTMYDAEPLIHLIRLGVRGFLKKDSNPPELRYAMHCILENGTYYSQQVTGRLFNLMKNQSAKTNAWGATILNDSELAFLRLAATELTYKEIAEKLEISPRTIDNYRDSLFIKLNVKSRVGLAMYAVKTGIVTVNF